MPVGLTEDFQSRARRPPRTLEGAAGADGAFHSVQLGSILWHVVSRLVFRRQALARTAQRPVTVENVREIIDSG